MSNTKETTYRGSLVPRVLKAVPKPHPGNHCGAADCSGRSWHEDCSQCLFSQGTNKEAGLRAKYEMWLRGKSKSRIHYRELGV